MTTIRDFYINGAANTCGETLNDIMSFDDETLEARHDYIQWLFPLPEPSAYNKDAPLLQQEDVEMFLSHKNAKYFLMDAANMMLCFYTENKHWITLDNHNFKRITRILKCLSLCELNSVAAAFLSVIMKSCSEDEKKVFGASVGYWEGVTHV